MKTLKLLNYARDSWIAGEGTLAEISSAIDGSPVAQTGSAGLDFSAMLRHAREAGVRLTLGRDAHDTRELENIGNSERQSRRAWVERKQVVNTWTAKQFLKWTADKRVG